MTHSITAIENDTRSLTSCIKTENSLLLEEDLWRAKLFKKDVCSFYTIAIGIEWWFSKKNRMFFSGCFQFIKDMSPELLHVIPVLNNAMLNWIVEFENASVFIL